MACSLLSFFFPPSAYHSKSLRCKMGGIFSHDGRFQMMSARFGWSKALLTAGPGLEPWGGAFPREEEQSALGGKKRDRYQQVDIIFI